MCVALVDWNAIITDIENNLVAFNAAQSVQLSNPCLVIFRASDVCKLHRHDVALTGLQPLSAVQIVHETVRNGAFMAAV